MLQVLGMFKQLFLLFMGDVLLDDDVVRILLFPCKLLVLYWGRDELTRSYSHGRK
jgi:hypothetical protein